MDLTIWLGPIASFQFTPNGWPAFPGSSVVNYEIHNAAQAAPFLAKWTSADGRVLPGLLASLGLSEAAIDRLFLGSFSAGHDIAKPLTKHPDDRAKITALMLADSAQSSPGVVPPGYLAYASESASGAPRLFCASASTITSGAYWSSQATMDALTGAIGPSSGDLSIPPLDPPPEGVWNIRNAVVLDYGQSLAHTKHATLLAPQLWQGLLVPWVEGGMGQGPPPGPPIPAAERVSSGRSVVKTLLGLAAITAAGYGAYRIAQKRRR